MALGDYPVRASIGVKDTKTVRVFLRGRTAARTREHRLECRHRRGRPLTAAGAEFIHYEGFDQDERGIGPRAGGGRVAWVEDLDGNTLAFETDYEERLHRGASRQPAARLTAPWGAKLRRPWLASRRHL